MRNITILLLLAAFLILGCSKDAAFTDVDGLAPSLALEADAIATESGREFVIKGRVEDKDGIRSINLRNEALHLNKTIDLTLDSTIYEYDLKYKFRTPKDEQGDNFTIVVTVEDLGGRTVQSNVLVTMDGDFTNPIFTVSPDQALTVLLKATTRLNVKFSVEDDKALDLVRVNIPELDYSREVTDFTDGGRKLEFNEPIALPSELATYTLTVQAVDKAGLTSEKTSVITVSEMPDFAKMYLADVATAQQLNNDVFGIPMLIDRIEAYTYRARYYSDKAGKEIRFIPQKTDFSPISFGVDPVNSSLLTDDPEVSLPITLPAKGYYEIIFNVQSGTYDVKQYTPTDAPIAIGTPMLLDASRPGEGSIPLQIGLVGSGVPGAGNWDTGSPLILHQDNENKCLLSVEMTLEAGAELEFIIQTQHSWGWWPEPFWRWDRGDDPEVNVFNGGNNPAKWQIKTSGKYMFKFDTHLKRSQLYPIN